MRRAGLLALLLATGAWDALRAADPDVDQGNQAYRDGHYDQALGHYRSAEERGGDPRLHFDMGTALYKLAEKSTDEEAKGKLYQQAEEAFRRAADTDDVRLKSSAYYNLGNTMYQRRQWEDAITSYKRALRADPKNDAARHNLEMALRQREKQEKQEKQQQEQKGKQGQRGQKDKPKQGQGEQDQPQQQPKPDQPQDGQPGQEGQAPQPKPPPQPPPQGQAPDPTPQDPQAQQERDGRAQERQEERAEQPGQSDSPSDQDRKLDELERRSRDLRKRLLRQGTRTRDPLRLPSRRDW